MKVPAWSDPKLRRRHTIDLLSRDFEELWQAGQNPDIATFLKTVDAHLQKDLLPELVAAEWELRLLAGESPVRSDYEDRFPQLTGLLTELAATDFLVRESTNQTAAPSWPQPGEEFCGYRILKELGRGAMGTVFLAEVPVIGHQVALKVLETSLRESHVAVTRFEREAKLLSKLDHPGIVPLYSYGESQGLRYLVMKAINGISLASVIAGSEPSGCSLPAVQSQDRAARTEQWLSIARQLTEALQAIHSAEVLHRDIKPSNILLTNNGQVFLTDFSLARIESAGLDITRSDEFVGTLRYCAPESLDGIYSKQGDIYSLGLVLFELFSLTTPFAANSRRELLNRKLSGAVPEMAGVSGAIPKPLLQILQRMTAYESADRYQSANEVIEALASYQNPAPGNTQNRSQKRILTAAIMLGISSVVLLSTIPWHTSTEHSEQSPISKSEGADFRTSQIAVNTPEKPVTLYAMGIDVKPITPDTNNWLIPERSFELPRKTQVSLVSLSEDGTHVVFVMLGASLFMGQSDAERLPMISRPYQCEVAAVDQSVNGDHVMFVNRDFGRPPGIEQDIEERTVPQYFIEIFNKSREKWIRISGPLFRFSHGMPAFISGPPRHHKQEVLIPEPDSPIIFHPQTSGYQYVEWPKGAREAVSCYFQNGIASMRDGKVNIFPLGYRDLEGTQDSTKTIETPVGDCQLIKSSSDGRYAVIAGKSRASIISTADATLLTTIEIKDFQTIDLSFSADGRRVVFSDSHQVRVYDLSSQQWMGDPERMNGELLLAILISDSLLTVEKSGRVRLLKLGQPNPEPVREFQSERLSAATLSVASRRLVLGTEIGRVMFFRVP